MSVWEDADEDEEGWDGRQESVGGLSNSSSSPLALLSHVVLLQKELEQQRAALSTMQQQLDHTSNRCASPAVLACMHACNDTLSGPADTLLKLVVFELSLCMLKALPLLRLEGCSVPACTLQTLTLLAVLLPCDLQLSTTEAGVQAAWQSSAPAGCTLCAAQG